MPTRRTFWLNRASADLRMLESDAAAEAGRDSLRSAAGRTSAHMLAYRLGWMKRVLPWDGEEAAGRQPVMPMCRHFYDTCAIWLGRKCAPGLRRCWHATKRGLVV